MRCYLIDEISHQDMTNIEAFLRKNAIQSGLEKIFWVRIPDDLLNNVQSQHKKCQPYVFAIEVGNGWIKAEFFIRSQKVLQCTCPAYSTPEQRNYIIHFIQNMIEKSVTST